MRGLEPTTAARFPFRVLFACFACALAGVLAAVAGPSGRSQGLAVRVIVAPACSVVVQAASPARPEPLRQPWITCTRGQAPVHTAAAASPPAADTGQKDLPAPTATTTLVTIDF